MLGVVAHPRSDQQTLDGELRTVNGQTVETVGDANERWFSGAVEPRLVDGEGGSKQGAAPL